MKTHDITDLVDFVQRSDGSMSIEPKRPDCGCPQGVCQPQHNEGTWCWRSGCLVPVGYFSDSITEPRAQSATDIQLHGCRIHGRRDCKTC